MTGFRLLVFVGVAVLLAVIVNQALQVAAAQLQHAIN
jgi:hypothetical protein